MLSRRAEMSWARRGDSKRVTRAIVSCTLYVMFPLLYDAKRISKRTPIFFCRLYHYARRLNYRSKTNFLVTMSLFLYLSVFLTSRGMLWGNVIGIALLVTQKYFEVITLNPESYYVDVVPVNINVVHILLLNIGSLIVTTLMLVIPSYLVSKISPDKTIRFD